MTQQNLPAYLQQYQAPDVGATLSANLGSAMPPHVSIGGGRFTLVDASNNEIPVPTFDPVLGVYLDAVIIDSNPVMSRIYFSGAYDAGAEGVRPDCFSDNGVGPSISASSPQAPTCAVCPRAEWTKVNANGKKVPWCSQKQKVALLIPGFPTLFLLAVPPNSHSYLREYVEKCKGNGANVANLITRISFVPGVQGTLQFQPVSWIDETVAQLRQAAYAEKKTDALVGRTDVARPAASLPPPQGQPTTGLIGAPVMQPVNYVPAVPAQPTMGQWPPQPLAAAPQPAAFGQFQQVQQPAPFAAQQPQAAGFAPTAAATGSSPASTAQPAAQSSPSEQPATGRRRRRTAAEMQAASEGQPAAQTAPAPAQAPFPVVQTAAGPQTDMGFGISTGQPAGASAEVSAMLDDFFGKG